MINILEIFNGWEPFNYLMMSMGFYGIINILINTIKGKI